MSYNFSWIENCLGFVIWARRGPDRMVIGFTTSAYHH